MGFLAIKRIIFALQVNKVKTWNWNIYYHFNDILCYEDLYILTLTLLENLA